jgi:TolA-binding protein
VAAALGLPHIYFQLANARKAVGASKESIAEAYSKAFGPSNLSSAQERSVGLRWLLQNGFKDDLTEAIKSFAQEGPPNRALIDDVCRHLESEEDWAGFELFLDTLFTQAKNPAEWMMVVESSLSDKTNRWAKGYFSYIAGRPALKFSRDCAAAERYLADEEYEKAARLYKDIVNRCSSTDDKALFEFQLCKSLFYADRPAEVIAMLESFTASYGATHSRMAADALLMKGRLYLQLREIDQALNAFRRVASEYPRTEQVPEAEFFVGYCYVLSNRRQEAAQALAKVAQDYPDSGWASKARLCLARTETMADAGIAE